MPRGIKPTGKPRGRPKSPANEEGRWAVYLAKGYHGPLGELAKINRRAMRVEIELAVEERLRAAGLWPPADA